MEEITKTNLAGTHTRKLRFRYHGNALTGGRTVLRVTDGIGGWLDFQCEGEGGSYTISGSQWTDFAASRIYFMVTLYKEDGENFYKIEVGFEGPKFVCLFLIHLRVW